MTKQDSIVRLLIIICLTLALAGITQKLGAAPCEEGCGSAPSSQLQSSGLTASWHYTLTARVRLLLFWISREGVGGGRIALTEGTDGSKGVELLIGSDPARAPMRINRWGYVSESIAGSSAQLLGVMTASDEQSIEQAKAGVTRPGTFHKFKAIRGSVSENHAQSTIIQLLLSNEFTYRDLDALLHQLPQTGTATRQTHIPNGTEPGFLIALKNLVHNNVESYRRSGRVAAGQYVRRNYVYDATLYELTQKSCRFLPELAANNRMYRSVLESEFEARNTRTGEISRFSLTYGTQDLVAETPIRIVYRPRWWFEAELMLDTGVKPVEVAERGLPWKPGSK